jgi:DNA-binding transcriptional LysR family regulator
MTLRQLEIFTTIVESGSFTRAAEKLRVAQPSISQQIQQLEAELGEQLLVRMRNRRMFITEAGKVVQKHADHILRQAEILRMEVASITQEPSGEILIGIGGHQLTVMVASALSRFHKKFPRIRLDIENATTPIILDLLRGHRLDLGIVTLPVSDKGLKTEVLFREEMVVVVRKNSPLASKRQLAPAEIGKLPLVLYDRNTRTRAMLNEFFREAGIAPEVVLELSSVEAMKMMVEAGFGATIIPISAVRALPYRDTLHPLRIRGRPLVREVGVATGEFSRLPRVLDELLLFVREQFQAIYQDAV